ncbi:PQQ-binding-like beta-propeller repeat protein [Tundrisphaera lichenicola]|uniref:outer membrane protein assembly factor BamB family protein n=1 Tax=Tundrisphaera lichenicola TaxID=2029860 RepID=UPI003EB7E3FC
MTRPVSVTLLFLTILFRSIAQGQAPDDDKADQVSNDNPSRPFQMPPASAEVKEALDDFERFGRRGAWERALKSLYTIPEAQASRFLDGEGGFIIPVSKKRHSVLAGLPVEGQAAYRVFYDSEAKKLLDEADGPTLLSSLERVYSAYFTTSIGDNAADRLGDLYYELGRFDRAADCWLAILRERPDTDLAPGLISLKAALALHRSGRRSEFDQVRSELADRHDDEKVTIGGSTGRPTELLKSLIGEDPPASKAKGPAAGPAEAGLDLAETVESAWQVRFAESIEAGMTPPELTQWESNALSAVVPAVADGGSSIFVNFLGYVFALDAKSGKMLWRSGSFHHLDILAMQGQAQMIDPARFAVVASDDLVWTVGRDLKDQNMFAPFRLTCLRAEGGEVVWRSEDLADYAQVDLYGVPLLADGKLFVVGKSLPNPQQQELPKQFVLAIEPRDGKVLWKTEAGTFRQGPNMYYYYYSRDTTPQPTLILDAGAIYLDTHAGVMARLDADSGTLDWGFGYKTEASEGQSRFFYYNMPSEPSTASGPPGRFGDALLVKGAKSDQLVAVDPDRMKVVWDRPISTSSRLLGTVGDLAILGGPEISALDLKSRQLLWATRIPGGSLEARVIVRPDGIWQLTPRGIFEIDPGSGQVRRIFRGGDLGSAGGDLLLTNSWLISASNRTISAYPRRASGADRAALEDAGASRKRASNE